jgi:hypothetical protein
MKGKKHGLLCLELGGDPMAKILNDLVKNWSTVVLFVAGLVLVAIAAFLFNQVLGFLISGLELMLMAYILDKEGGES